MDEIMQFEGFRSERELRRAAILDLQATARDLSSRANELRGEGRSEQEIATILGPWGYSTGQEETGAKAASQSSPAFESSMRQRENRILETGPSTSYPLTQHQQMMGLRKEYHGKITGPGEGMTPQEWQAAEAAAKAAYQAGQLPTQQSPGNPAFEQAMARREQVTSPYPVGTYTRWQPGQRPTDPTLAIPLAGEWNLTTAMDYSERPDALQQFRSASGQMLRVAHGTEEGQFQWGEEQYLPDSQPATPGCTYVGCHPAQMSERYPQLNVFASTSGHRGKVNVAYTRENTLDVTLQGYRSNPAFEDAMIKREQGLTPDQFAMDMLQTWQQQPMAQPASGGSGSGQMDLDRMLLQYTNRGYDIGELRTILRQGFEGSGVPQTLSNAQSFLNRRLPAIARAQGLGMTPLEANQALAGTDPTMTTGAQLNLLSKSVLGARGLPMAGMPDESGREMRPMSPVSWMQTTSAHRAQLRTATYPTQPGVADPGNVIKGRAAKQFNLEQTLSATPWEVSGGEVRTGLEGPSKLVKRASQMIAPYEQVYLGGKPVTEAPWKMGPTSDIAERGQILNTLMVAGGLLPEGMSAVEQSLGNLENLRRVQVKLPTGFEPQDLTEAGTTWGQGETAALFKGHTGLDIGDWDVTELMSRTFTPGTGDQPGVVEALLKRGIDPIRGFGMSFGFAKDLAVGMDLEKLTGMQGIDVVKSGGARDVYALAQSALAAMSPDQFKQVTGMDMPPTWQEAATRLTDIFSGKVAPANARIYNFEKILSGENLAAFQQAGRVVGEPEDIGGGRYRANVQFPGMEMPMFHQFTRAGAYETRKPFLGSHTISRIQQSNPALFAQMMHEDVLNPSSQSRRELIRTYLATAGKGLPPSQFTAAEDVPWEAIMTQAMGSAMEATGAEDIGKVPIGAMRSALLGAVPKELGALKFAFGGKDYYFQNPSTIPRVGGGVDWQEKSEYRSAIADLIQAQAGRTGTEETERAFGRQLFTAAFAQHGLAGSPETIRKARGLSPTSITSGVAAASYANLPGEVFMSTGRAAQTAGIGPREFNEFKRRFEAGEGDFVANIFREPTTSMQGVNVQARIRPIGMHPEEALRGANIPILSTQIGQALYGDFDKDDYMIAANFGVDLPTARQMREQDASIVQMAKSGVAGQAQKQIEEIAGKGDVGGMLNWLQTARTGVPLQDVEGMYAGRNQLASQMGLGFNAQQRMMAAAPNEAARSAADKIGAAMYMKAQDYEKWEGPLKRLYEMSTIKASTGGGYDVTAGGPVRMAFGASGMMGESARILSQLGEYLSPSEMAAMMTPGGNKELMAAVTAAFKEGDPVAAVAAIRGQMEMPEWAEQSGIGRFLGGMASERDVRMGKGPGITPELADVGGSLRELSGLGKGTLQEQRSLWKALQSHQAWSSVAGDPTGLGKMVDPLAGITLAGVEEVEYGAPRSQSEYVQIRGQWSDETGGVGASFEDWLKQKSGMTPGQLQGAPRAAQTPVDRAASRASGGRPPGGAPPSMVPPAAPPGGPPEEPEWEDVGGGMRAKPGAGGVTIQWPAVSRQDFIKSVRLLTDRLGEWENVTKDATEGTREYTKWEAARTKELIKAANVVERGMYRPEELKGLDTEMAQAMKLMGVQGKVPPGGAPGFGGLRAAEQRLEDIQWTPPEGQGGMGLGARFDRAAGKLMSGWELMRLQRMWGMTGGYAMGQIPIAAQQEMAATQAAMVGMPMGQYQMGGMGMDLMALQAQKQLFQGAVGRGAYGAYGNLMGATTGSTGLGTALGIGLPAIGTGLMGGIGATWFGMGTTAAMGAVGLPLALGAGAYGINQYQQSLLGDQERMAVIAAGGGTGIERWASGADTSLASALLGGIETPQQGNAAYGRQIMSGELSGLNAQGRVAAMQYAADTYAPDWMAPEQFYQSVGQWQRYTPGATNIQAITGNPMFEQMAMRGMNPQQFAQTAQQWGMGPQQWQQIAQQMLAVSEPEAMQGEFLAGQWQSLLSGGGMSGMDIRNLAFGGQLGQMSSTQQERAGTLGNLMRQMRGYGMDVTVPTTLGGIEKMWENQPAMQAQLGLAQQLTGMGAGMSQAGAAAQMLAPQDITGFRGVLGGDQWAMSRALEPGGNMDAYLGVLSELIPPGAMASLQEMAEKMTPIIDTSTGLRVGIVSNRATSEMGAQAYAEAVDSGLIGVSGLTANYAMMGSRERQARQTTLQRGYEDFQVSQQERRLGWSKVSQFGGSFEGFNTRGSFAIERELRNLSRIWEDFTTDYQEQNKQIQYRQFMENWQVKAERMPVQFQWQREDLAFQGAQASMQYGWGQEDIQERLRYATGRERRQLLRQQERSTISYAMQMGRLETQEGRLDTRQQWAQEDLEREKRHFLERFRLQDEYQNRYKLYIERRRELEDELQEIREFGARLNIDMQSEAIEKQKELQEHMRAIQDAQIAVSTYMENNVAMTQKWAQEITQAMSSLLGTTSKLKSVINSIKIPSYTSTLTTSGSVIEGVS